MKSKTLLAISAIIGLGIAVAMILDKGAWSVRPDTKQEVVTSAELAPTLTSTGAQSQASGIPASEAVQTETLNPEPGVSSEHPVAPAPRSPQSKSKFTADPDIARAALSLVGVDPDAEQYWAESIFDESLPAQQREDLMEDLNEDGLSDPKHPGPEDVPVILNRLRIIEDIAPYADEFMLEHLGEAYNDLLNMLAGQPVR